MAPSTAAPPDMSCFISSMFAAGLIEIPPESNVIPLPTNARVGRFFARADFAPFFAAPAPYSSAISRGG